MGGAEVIQKARKTVKAGGLRWLVDFMAAGGFVILLTLVWHARGWTEDIKRNNEFREKAGETLETLRENSARQEVYLELLIKDKGLYDRARKEAAERSSGNAD